MKIIGIADTTFTRFDMGGSAVDELKSKGKGFKIIRSTVPGIKDLPVACKKLFDEKNLHTDIDVILMLLPVPSKGELVNKLDERLKHMQSI